MTLFAQGVQFFANAGIPLLGFTIVLGWLTIIPVVLIEATIAMQMLRWKFFFALGWVFLANAISMILGMPIVWFLTVLVQMFIGDTGWGDGSIIGVLKGPAWLGPGYIDHLGWAASLGTILLCVPFYFMSWWVEYSFLYACAIRKDADAKPTLWSFAWKANFASYTLLVLLLVLTIWASGTLANKKVPDQTPPPHQEMKSQQADELAHGKPCFPDNTA